MALLKIYRVQGDSMSPRYSDGDYVLLMRPLFGRLREGDDVIALHPSLGTIFKRISGFDGDGVRLQGLNPESTPAAVMGSLPPSQIRGRVILHFPKK